MSTTMRPEPIITVNAGISDYRPRTAPKLPAKPRPGNTEVAAEIDAVSAPAPAAPPPLPDPAAPGTAFTAALLSATTPPLDITAQELLMRNGGDWVPPPSGYRLADRKV